jgi:hypothetical protein
VTSNQSLDIQTTPRPGRHAELVQLAARWLNGTRNCALVATERSCFKAREAPDAIGWRPAGESVLVEVKVSVEDFRADQRKAHRKTTVGMGLERWYLADDGVLSPAAMPPGWGLAVVRNGKVFRAVHAQVRSELAGEIARIEQPLLVAIVRRARWASAGDADALKGVMVDAEATGP